MPHQIEATPMRALDRIITHLNHHQAEHSATTAALRRPFHQATSGCSAKDIQTREGTRHHPHCVSRSVEVRHTPSGALSSWLKPSQPQNLLAEWPTTGPNSCAARHAIGPEAPRCLKRTTTIYRLPTTYPTALNSSQPDMASTSFALPAAFASNRKGAAA